MKRFKISLLSLLMLTFAGCQNTGQQKDSNLTKTNILFICADDWGWGDLSAHGHPYVKTPYIDLLVAGESYEIYKIALKNW